MVRIAGVLALTLAACSGSSSSRTPPSSCDPSVRVGTYLVHYDTVSGDCGTLPDSLIVLGGSSAGASTCTVDSFSTSHGNCRQDLSERCTSSTGSFSLAGYIIQETTDGSVIDGEVTLNLTVGFRSCVGTYRITYTRQ